MAHRHHASKPGPVARSVERQGLARPLPKAHSASYEVPRQASQTVLDVVTYIQRHLDPSLAYRFACRVGMCGSCAMTVNGKPRWTCRTHVAKVVERRRARDRAAREPAGGEGPGHRHERRSSTSGRAPRVSSRASDARRRLSRWSRPRRPSAPRPTPASNASAAASATPRATWWGGSPDYLGPAALNRAWTLVNDVRDVQQAERLRAVAGDAGCHSCHTQGSAPSAARSSSRRRGRSPGSSARSRKAAVRGEL